MLVGLVSMMGNVGATLISQGGGYGLIQTKMLWDNHPHDTVDVNPPPSTWGNYDLLYICEGVNFVAGSFNVPGGPQPLHTEKMKLKWSCQNLTSTAKYRYSTYKEKNIISLFCFYLQLLTSKITKL